MALDTEWQAFLREHNRRASSWSLPATAWTVTDGKSESLKASVIGLSTGDQPDRPLEKTWDDWTLLSTYGDDAWPYICATRVAEQGSLPPLRFGNTDSSGNFKFVPTNHPLQDLFDRPNPQNTGGELRQLLLLYMELVGHAPIEIVRPQPSARVQGKSKLGRKGFELYIHNPGPWRIVANPDATIRGYLYLNQNKAAGMGVVSQSDLRWDTTQMTYLRWPNPVNRWYGQGRQVAVRQAIMGEEYSAIRDKRFEQQFGVPPGILTSEMPLGSPQADELQRRWEKAVGGYQNAGRIAVLGSKTSYQPIAMSRADQQYLLSRHWRVQEIAGAFEVPLILVLMSEATYANAKEARAEWWEGSLSVKLQRIEEMCTERLIPMLTDEPLEARFDLSRVAALNENANEVADRAVKWSQSASVTRQEIRGLLGLPALGDERDTEIVVPATQRETIATAPTEQALPEASGPPGSEPKAPKTPPPAKAAVPEKVKRADPKEREGILSPVREAWGADLKTYFSAQRNALRPLGKSKAFDPAGMIERAIQTIGSKRFRDRFIRVTSGPIKTSVTIGARDATSSLVQRGVPASLTVLVSDASVLRVGTYIDRLGVTIANTTNGDVTKVISDWADSGGTVGELQDALSNLFDGYADWRVDRIARTETTSAYNLGAVDQYRDAGVQLVEVSDGDGDDECAAADGATWTLDDAEANPLAHPNCTRSWEPIIDEGDLDVTAPEE